MIHKGKGKPIFHHKSHRLVRVTPLFARIIDEYMRPAVNDIVRPLGTNMDSMRQSYRLRCNNCRCIVYTFTVIV